MVEEDMKLFVVAWSHRHGLDTGLIRALNKELLEALPNKKLLNLVWGETDFDETDEVRLKNSTDYICITEQDENIIPEFPFEITTDSETVWVNAPLCIGRFGRISGEIQKHDGEVVNIAPPDWGEWTAAMTKEHGVDFEGFSKPEWCNA